LWGPGEGPGWCRTGLQQISYAKKEYSSECVVISILTFFISVHGQQFLLSVFMHFSNNYIFYFTPEFGHHSWITKSCSVWWPTCCQGFGRTKRTNQKAWLKVLLVLMTPPAAKDLVELKGRTNQKARLLRRASHLESWRTINSSQVLSYCIVISYDYWFHYRRFITFLFALSFFFFNCFSPLFLIKKTFYIYLFHSIKTPLVISTLNN
jgi:hypothetical protein